MISLANKYRPIEFNEVIGQKAIVQILNRQLELQKVSNCYLFCGPSGTGKTTLARIFANKINSGHGTPIEVDAASNNGVDNVRMIIEDAQKRAIDAEYKIIIIDECHAITSAGWQAFLKCIEEPPMYTIFIFCTTDPQKVPATIQNRVMRFNFSRLSKDEIKSRLMHICENEKFSDYVQACDYISKICNGGVRDAIAMLEKCSNYSTTLSIDNVITSLGSYDYTMLFDLTNAIIDKNKEAIISLINSYYDSGKDLKLFIDQLLDFILDLTKFCMFKDIGITAIPSSYKDEIIYTTGSNQADNSAYFNALSNKILSLKNLIRYDSAIKTTIIVYLLNLGDK